MIIIPTFSLAHESVLLCTTENDNHSHAGMIIVLILNRGAVLRMEMIIILMPGTRNIFSSISTHVIEKPPPFFLGGGRGAFCLDRQSSLP